MSAVVSRVSGGSSSPSYIIPTLPSNLAPISGQAIIAVTGTAVQLPSNALTQGVLIKANPNNVGNILIGPSGVTNTYTGSGNGHCIQPGETASAAVGNTNLLYINGTAGDWVSFMGS